MPIFRMQEIRNMALEERKERLNELRTELLRLKTMIKAGGTIENPARIGEIRKTIAKILTVGQEEKLGLPKEISKEKKRK